MQSTLPITVVTLLERYETAFSLYVETPDETHLAQGYELGREAADTGIGILQLSETHHRVLSRMIHSFAVTDISGMERVLRVDRAADFFAECLAAFEMIYRGYHTQISTMEQMSDMQDAQASLATQATHDALTGLASRDLLVDRIDQALMHSKRFGKCTAVFFVDLDRFKQINDTKGHKAGDRVLRKVAEQMIGVLRPMDTVARIGGDEFAVLAPEVDNHLHAVDIADRLVTALHNQLDELEEDVHAEASIGISISSDGRGTAETLLKEADTAMYKAKSLGGARAEVFDVFLGREIEQRAVAQELLRLALSEGRIIVYYQPVIDLSGGSVVGFEALARIVAGDGSIVLPGAFIPAAEDSGLVVPLGTQVLQMACQAARGWQAEEQQESQMTVAVNVSSRQLEGGNLTTIVQEILEKANLEPQQLHLELTETAIMDLRPEVVEQLEHIRDFGVQIGLDDFGTGYASLTHLRRLPLAFVKIDKTFVQDIETNKEDERIVSAVIDLAAHLGLRSIAEGVETSIQLDRLRELGCNQAQGYLFARPLPLNDVANAIHHSAW